MRILNVAEKPAMARQIATLLSSNSVTTSEGKNKFCKNFEFLYNIEGRSCTMIMTSVLGHVKELDFGPEYGNWNMTPPDSLFEAEVHSKVAEDKKGIVQNLQIQGRLAQMLVIWTDCDREGEHIGSEIVEICRGTNSRLDIYRARYSAVTQNELRRAMNNLQRLDDRQVAAVEARCELDLRSGAIFTRFQTLRLRDHFPSISKEVISYGPCQFPTLGFVVEQYLKVSRFRPEPFWYLDLQIAKDGERNRFIWKRGHLFDRLITLILYERSLTSSEGHAKIIKVEEKPTSKYRPLPLRTVEFQKAASRFLKISSDQVMTLAEKLYNRGFISYPRTETDLFEFSTDQLKALVQKQVVDNAFGDYARDLMDSDGFRTPRKGKNNDKAHPPIHPTSSGEDLGGQERAVFEFVARRFLACCSEDARGMETKILAQVGIEEFECKGIRVTELNYLMVYKYEKWTEQEIAPFRHGEIIPIEEFLMKDGATSVPLLLSESDLITCMDKNGIGTDATIHEHIKKILLRFYAIKGRDSRFIPTRLGVALVEAFDKLGLDFSLTQPKIRAKLERDLASICRGELLKEQVIRESKEMYRSVYRKVEDEFEGLLRVFSKYLGNSRRGDNHDRGGSGHGPNDDNDNEDGDGDLPPGNPFDSMPIPKHYRSNPSDEDDGSDGPDDTKSEPTKGKKRSRTVAPKTVNRDENFKATKTVKKPRVSKKSDSTTTFSSPNCLCSVVAVKRTVNKDGPNKGRQFWGCSKDFNAPDNCKFFEWAIEGEVSIVKPAISNSTTESYRSNNSKNFLKNNLTLLDDEGDLRCKCGLIMKQDTMKTGKDAGRQFAKCPKIIQRCGMFLFLDNRDVEMRSEEDNGDDDDDDDHNYQGYNHNNNNRNNTKNYKVSGKSKSKSAYNKNNNNTSKKQKCFKCNKTGHWANVCPNS